jgi:DNA-binding NarL/FixJ family response regulator
MKILIVDDHTLFRAGLRMLLAPLQDTVEVIESNTSAEALEVLKQHNDISLCLLDLALRNEDGIFAIGSLQHAQPGMAVVVISADENAETIYRALDAGAMGYVPKSVTPEVMTQALKLVLAGSIYLPPALLDGGRPARTCTGTAKFCPESLTERQKQVLQCVMRGWPTKLISDHLNLSENTVKTHLTAIYRAFNVTSRAQAMVVASRMGIRPQLTLIEGDNKSA